LMRGRDNFPMSLEVAARLLSRFCKYAPPEMAGLPNSMWDCYMQNRVSPGSETAKHYSWFLKRCCPEEKERLAQANHFAQPSEYQGRHNIRKSAKPQQRRKAGGPESR